MVISSPFLKDIQCLCIAEDASYSCSIVFMFTKAISSPELAQNSFFRLGHKTILAYTSKTMKDASFLESLFLYDLACVSINQNDLCTSKLCYIYYMSIYMYMYDVYTCCTCTYILYMHKFCIICCLLQVLMKQNF